VQRFGIKAQISFLSLLLLVIPVLTWSYWKEIQQTAISAQGRVQLIETKAIATSLVATQVNISKLLAGNEDSELEKYALSAPTTSSPIRLDGQFDDWGDQTSIIEAHNSSFPLWSASTNMATETKFGLALTQNEQYLYIALSVLDRNVQTRQPNHLRLDYNDHIQLTFRDQLDALRRVIIPAQGEGDLASYFTNLEWKYGIDAKHPVSGEYIPSHKTGIQGYWRGTYWGYNLELRINKNDLDGQDARLHLAVVDIDDNPAFGPSAIVASLPKQMEDKLNPLGLHARELQRVIDQLQTTYSRLWIYDKQGREWAYGGRDAYKGDKPKPFDSQCVQNALQQSDDLVEFKRDHNGELRQIVSCFPITESGEVLGVVVIDESASHVLAQEEDKVRSIAFRLAFAICIVILIFVGYAFFLVRRVTQLNAESQRSIDEHGRIEKTEIQASKNFPDEIGDLSRAITQLLQKQRAYTSFLERIPQTLRHEISNPLNKLKTSIELLTETQPELKGNRYLERIDAGADQLHQITAHLTEAASLESAMQSEQLSSLDLTKFLHRYFDHWEEPVHVEFEVDEEFQTLGDASRLEQMFDKIMDNAQSFCAEGGQITVRIKNQKEQRVVEIDNDGPLLPTEKSMELFSPMVSTRSTGKDIHLGLGLHVVKLIADKHQAELTANNREDGRGVVFSLGFKAKI